MSLLHREGASSSVHRFLKPNARTGTQGPADFSPMSSKREYKAEPEEKGGAAAEKGPGWVIFPESREFVTESRESTGDVSRWCETSRH